MIPVSDTNFIQNSHKKKISRSIGYFLTQIQRTTALASFKKYIVLVNRLHVADYVCTGKSDYD